MSSLAVIRHCDNLDPTQGLPSIADASVDAIVTDPPSGTGFMGKKWDDHGGRAGFVSFLEARFLECYRVLKPGGWGVVWALPRTSHWTAWAIENAAFEIRDVITHHYGQGFAKGADASKLIDRKLGATRKVVGVNPNHRAVSGVGYDGVYNGGNTGNAHLTAPATAEAEQWDGFGTTLKPASEHWILVRKPFKGGVANNLLKFGTGALNIEGCRVSTDEKLTRVLGKTTESDSGWKSTNRSAVAGKDGGRWPPNLVLTHNHDCAETCTEGCPALELDRQSGIKKEGVAGARGKSIRYGGHGAIGDWGGYGGSGGASRLYPQFRFSPDDEVLFKYIAKPSRTEKKAGLDGKNTHPTVKAVALMRWLCRLITPPGGLVVDPFAGSGTTGVACVKEGFQFIGMEDDPPSVTIARCRLQHALDHR